MANDRRESRLCQLLEEFGCATGCDTPERRPLHRWALLEADEGPANNGGPWWTFGADWTELLKRSAAQEKPKDWPAQTLFDLDTDWSTEIETTILYEPAVTPAA